MDTLKGQLLIAGAGIFGAAFRQTVVLVAEHDESNALGFVVNRPSELIAAEAADELARLPLPDPRIYHGGPVQPGAVAVLGEFEDPGYAGNLIFGSIGMLGAGPEGISVEGVKRAKVFSGYAGWGAGQLESELDEGAWVIEDARVEDLFTREPDRLWRDVLRRKGGEFVMLSTMSADPTAN
ncbi:MAG TPA: YqgE/AlgH family protein [Actinomycetota bacterium]|nr:YqgE/AlgH family protein [Actinomycetota bacterium]